MVRGRSPPRSVTIDGRQMAAEATGRPDRRLTAGDKFGLSATLCCKYSPRSGTALIALSSAYVQVDWQTKKNGAMNIECVVNNASTAFFFCWFLLYGGSLIMVCPMSVVDKTRK